MADLAVVHIDENDDRRLRIFTFTDGDWAPEVDTTLRPEVSFVDVARLDGRDRLIIYGDGRLTWFDPETGTERELAAVEVHPGAPTPDGGTAFAPDVGAEFVGRPAVRDRAVRLRPRRSG